MSATQLVGAGTLAVIGLILIIVSATSRDTIDGKISSFANHLSKSGLFLGAFFMLPLLLMLLTGIVVGFR